MSLPDYIRDTRFLQNLKVPNVCKYSFDSTLETALGCLNILANTKRVIDNQHATVKRV